MLKDIFFLSFIFQSKTANVVAPW